MYTYIHICVYEHACAFMHTHIHAQQGTEYLKEDKNLRIQVTSWSLLIGDKNDKEAAAQKACTSRCQYFEILVKKM